MKRYLIAAILALVVPWQLATASPALADPTLTVSPNPAAAGHFVVLSGTGYVPGQDVTLDIGISGVASQTAHATNQGTVGAQFVIPSTTPAGQYTATATSGTQTLASATYQISSPQITVSPNPANPGDTLTVSGTGFAQGSLVTVHATFNLTDNSTPQTVSSQVSVNPDGTFSTTVTVPSDAAGGNYVVHASADVNSADFASTPLTVNGTNATVTTTETPTATATPSSASITLNPSTQSAGAGSTVTVSGAGFGASESVLAHYPAILTGGGTVTEGASGFSDSSGNVTISDLPVPANVAPGTYTVTATGATSHRSATAQLVVTGQTSQASVSVSPTSAAPGGTITVSGTQFTANASVAIAVQLPASGGATTTLNATATSDSSGSFSVQVHLPTNATTGTATVTASQSSSGVSASTTFTIAALNAGISLSPSATPPGTTVTVSGQGFSPSNDVTISVPLVVGGSQQNVTASATADSSGAWTATFDVPSGTTPASYTVTATQSASGATASASLQVQAVSATDTPTPTPTETPAATPTNTPVPTPTKTPTKKPQTSGALHFKSLVLWFHNVRVGTFDYIAVQGTPGQYLGIWAHIFFPSGFHYDYYEITDSHGHWTKLFSVPKDAINRNSNRGHIELQLWLGKRSVKDFIGFTLLP